MYVTVRLLTSKLLHNFDLDFTILCLLCGSINLYSPLHRSYKQLAKLTLVANI
jgi:hypothetical protein